MHFHLIFAHTKCNFDKIFYFSAYEKGLDLAAKPLGKVGLSSNQVRKRLSRKSPGPELRKTLRSIPPPTNVTGPETVCLILISINH